MKIEMKSGPLHFACAIGANITIAFGFGMIIHECFVVPSITFNDGVQAGIFLISLGLVGWLAVICYGRSLIIDGGRLVVRNYFRKIIFECLITEIDKVEMTGFHNIALFIKDKKFKIPSDLRFTSKIQLLEEIRLKKLSRNHPDIFVLNAYLKELTE